MFVEPADTFRECEGDGLRCTWGALGLGRPAAEIGRDLDAGSSSAIAGMFVALPCASLALASAVAALGTRLIIGLMPAVLSVLLLETPEPDCEALLFCFDIGVGGEEESSVRSNA